MMDIYLIILIMAALDRWLIVGVILNRPRSAVSSVHFIIGPNIHGSGVAEVSGGYSIGEVNGATAGNGYGTDATTSIVKRGQPLSMDPWIATGKCGQIGSLDICKVKPLFELGHFHLLLVPSDKTIPDAFAMRGYASRALLCDHVGKRNVSQLLVREAHWVNEVMTDVLDDLRRQGLGRLG